ncbi:uncharacterized protein LOC142180866 [Nicotiana tabacum]|uniref:Uncharacterized protein LOC142180866 n=1 Tax=Nicotiana tabacum TaxID=4097 RepID=A0AC58UHU9_TOBAC
MSPKLVNGIVYDSNAHEVWTDLQDRFNKINGSRIYNLYRKIAAVSQGTSSISAYHSRLKLLWDAYSSLIPNLLVTPETREFITHLEQQKLFQFLMRLNDSFSAIRSQMLLLSPSPSVSHAYAMLIHEESQRKVCMTNTHVNEVNDSTALMSSRDNPQKVKRYGNLSYEYCRIKGHTKDTCYKLVGYPPGFKGKKKHEYRQANAAMVDGFHAKDDMFQAATSADSNVARQGMHKYFTDEQYNQIIKLLNQDKGEEFAANMAGNTDSQLTQTCDIPWIIDTGATNYMTSNINLLTNITKLPNTKGCNVHLPNRKSVPVVYQGNCNITGGESIYNVLCDLRIGKVKGIEDPTADNNVWHRRLGHVPARVMRQLAFMKNKMSIDYNFNKCTVHPLSRHPRKPFPLNDHSKMIWVFLMKLKSDTIVLQKPFIKMENVQFNHNVKCFRTDNGAEFFISEFTSQNDKLLPRAIAAVHMEYSTSQKGMDVIFREDVFPFMIMKEGRSPPLFFEKTRQYAIEQHASPQQHTHVQEMQDPAQEMGQPHAENEDSIPQLDDLSSSDNGKVLL